MATAISLDSSTAPPLPLHRFSVEQYHRLGELGVLSAEDRVELLEGWIVQKMNQRPIHGFTVRWLHEWLQRQLESGWLCQCQLPITTARSEPEPDLAIIQGAHQDFRQRHPSGAECRLVIEVADTSLLKDRAKAAIYQSAGVQEYWIVNLIDRQIERYNFADNSDSLEPQLLTAADSVEISIGREHLRLTIAQLFVSE